MGAAGHRLELNPVQVDVVRQAELHHVTCHARTWQKKRNLYMHLRTKMMYKNTLPIFAFAKKALKKNDSV